MSLNVFTLKNRNILFLFQGSLWSSIGTYFFAVSMSLYIKGINNSPKEVALAMALASFPSLLFTPLGGVLSDFANRVRVLVWLDIISGFLMLGFAFYLDQAHHFRPSYVLHVTYGVIFSINVIQCFFVPTATAIIGDVASGQELPAAYALRSISNQASGVMGRALAGFLVALVSYSAIALLNGMSFFFSAYMGSLIKTIEQKHPVSPLPRKNWKLTWNLHLQSLTDGFTFVRSQKGMLTLLLGAAVSNALLASIFIFTPFYILDFLKASTWWYGLFSAGFSLGAIAGALSSTIISNKFKKNISQIIRNGLILQGVPLAFLPFVPHPIFSITLLFLSAFFYGLIGTFIDLIFQHITSTVNRGRIFAIMGTISGIFNPLVMLAAGFLGTLAQEHLIALFPLLGISMVLMWLLLFATKDLNLFIERYPSFRP